MHGARHGVSPLPNRRQAEAAQGPEALAGLSPLSAQRPASGVFLFHLLRLLLDVFLDRHIAELIEIEDLAAILAFDVFNVLFARYDANLRMTANFIHVGMLTLESEILGKIVPADLSLSNQFSYLF